jgi:ribosomal protein S18 acetylase RimI-like enzyme
MGCKTGFLRYGNHLMVQTITYFKRFRMEIDLEQVPLVPPLLVSFGWLSWHDSLVDLHADVKFESFRDEIDALIFPSLSTRQGCVCLMNEIRRRPGFIREATWLIVSASGPCGTVQGLRERNGMGSIQNLGVAPQFRGRGLGEALLLQALHGFRRAGLGRAFLEVTAQNDGAIRLYRRIGFRCRKTVYKAVETSAGFMLAGESGR